MKKSKIFMLVSIITLAIVIVSSVGTYAWYVWSTSEDEETQIVTSLGAATVYFDAGASINANLSPTEDKENGIVKTISVAKNSTSVLTFNLYLDLNVLDEGLKDESFRYQIYKADTLVKEGNFSQTYLSANSKTCEKNSTTHIVLLSNEKIDTSITTYTLYIWIDGVNYTNPSSMQGASFSFDLHAEGVNAIVKEGVIPDISDIPEEQKDTLAYKILSDYYFAERVDVTNNGVVYHYDNNNMLMSDMGGNVRYFGADPNNYVYFNCSDYSNQSADTCEIWRIIGVFDGKIKLIRTSSIGSFSWDNKNIETGAETNNGSNDWTDARLMKLLNPGYETETIGGSLYYNSGSGNCYAGQNNASKACNFTNIGIKNEETRNMIADATWNLGGITGDANSIYSDVVYEAERGSNVYEGRPTTWIGKVAIPYVSDYGYAADFTSCSNTLGNYGDTTCSSVNWMYKYFGGDFYWLLTPRGTGLSYSAWRAWNSPYSVHSVYKSYIIIPTLHLNSSVIVVSGTGTSSDPYHLG